MAYNPQNPNVFTYAGNPNGHVAGAAAANSAPADYCQDTTGGILYECLTTGTTSTTVWAPLVYTKSVTSYGARGNGSTDDTAAITTAAAAGPVVFPAGAYVVSSSISFTSQVTMLPGSSLLIGTGATLVFSGGFSAPTTQQVFVCSGTGKVQFAPAKTSTDFPEWWGADSASTNDDLSAIQAAIDAFPNGLGCVVLQSVGYRVSGPITITKSHMTLQGTIYVGRDAVDGNCTVYSTSTTAAALYLSGGGGSTSFDGTLENTVIQDVMFSRLAMGALGSKTVIVQNTIHTTFIRSGASRSQFGLVVINANGIRLQQYHATVGGDLADNVFGVYVDGSALASTGILMEDVMFYGGSTPSGTSFMYHDICTNGAQSTGDRRFHNIECSGATDYMIWIQDYGGFSSDVLISEFTADAITKQAITIISPTPQQWQQASISQGWLNLTGTSSTGAGIQIEGRSGTTLSNVKVVNAATNTNQTAYWLKGFRDSAMVGCIAQGNTMNALVMAMDPSSNVSFNSSVSSFVAGSGGAINISNTSGCSFMGLSANNGSLTLTSTTSYNRVYGSAIGTVTNSGTGNVLM